jgi:subtilisin-like proprotein convertase family protein
MRTRVCVAALAAALAAIGLTASTASAATTTFTNSGAVAIPDVSNAVPYPSTINVSGLAGPVQKATVTLHNFQHTYPDDLAVLLAGPGGQNTILMGRVGGTDDPGVITLTFDQSATNSLNDTDLATSGTYKPSESATTTVEPLSPPAPGGPTYPVDLNVFTGAPANGAWNLFIADQDGGDSGTLAGGWSLNLTAPVNTMTLGAATLNKKKGTARLPVTVGDAGNLSLSGKGVKGASVAAGGPGTTSLTVKAKGKTAKKLSSAGKAKVKVTVTFTPNGGSANTQTAKIKLKKKH